MGYKRQIHSTSKIRKVLDLEDCGRLFLPLVSPLASPFVLPLVPPFISPLGGKAIDLDRFELTA
jgi:hypothetical protein